MYLQLDFKHIILTIERLEVRVAERFPASGLRQVCNEFHALAARSRQEILWLVKANIPIRLSIFALVSFAILAIVLSINAVEVEIGAPKFTEWVAITDVLINELILLSAGLFFLFTLEKRIKRARVLKALHQLRSIAHVVDMHQLTKDPSMLDQHLAVSSSPKRDLTGFQLKRYLDYCSELLSLIGKLAALYSERLPEPEIVTAANEIEELCTSLSRKIWQKISTIDDN